VIINGLVSIIRKSDCINAEIITAFDGIDAIEKLQKAGADLVITDISMPGMNGLELIKEAQDRKYCRHFIILTGFDEFEFARQAIRYKVNDYLLKPINKEELIEIILKAEREIKGEPEPGKEIVLPDIEACKITVDPDKCSERMKKILYYINDNYNLDISLNQIGNTFSLHPNYICSLFSQETGMTFLQYLDSVRIRKSIEMLLDSEKVIKDVAEKSGFMNIFIKKF
jgi:YesN/AraC family two-component response regulator